MLFPLTKNTLPSSLALHILPGLLALTYVPALLAGLSTPTPELREKGSHPTPSSGWQAS